MGIGGLGGNIRENLSLGKRAPSPAGAAAGDHLPGGSKASRAFLSWRLLSGSNTWTHPVVEVIPHPPVLDVGNMNDWQRKSPLDWETYVNKLVKVVAVEKHEYEGWVLTVDPVSATIVLATFPENEKGSISFIMGHAIQEVEILREGDSDMRQRLARISAPEESQAYSPEELEKRRKALKSWLETNHIPVGEQGEQGRTLSVAGVLTIEPPYGPEQCSSANEIILSRVQDLLQGYLGQQRPGPAQEPFCL